MYIPRVFRLEINLSSLSLNIVCICFFCFCCVFHASFFACKQVHSSSYFIIASFGFARKKRLQRKHHFAIILFENAGRGRWPLQYLLNVQPNKLQKRMPAKKRNTKAKVKKSRFSPSSFVAVRVDARAVVFGFVVLFIRLWFLYSNFHYSRCVSLLDGIVFQLIA